MIEYIRLATFADLFNQLTWKKSTEILFGK